MDVVEVVLVLLLNTGMQKTNQLNGLGYIVCLNPALGLICIIQRCSKQMQSLSTTY